MPWWGSKLDMFLFLPCINSYISVFVVCMLLLVFRRCVRGKEPVGSSHFVLRRLLVAFLTGFELWFIVVILQCVQKRIPFTRLCRRLLKEGCWPRVWRIHHICPFTNETLPLTLATIVAYTWQRFCQRLLRKWLAEIWFAIYTRVSSDRTNGLSPQVWMPEIL